MIRHRWVGSPGSRMGSRSVRDPVLTQLCVVERALRSYRKYARRLLRQREKPEKTPRTLKAHFIGRTSCATVCSLLANCYLIVPSATGTLTVYSRSTCTAVGRFRPDYFRLRHALIISNFKMLCSRREFSSYLRRARTSRLRQQRPENSNGGSSSANINFIREKVP